MGVALRKEYRIHKVGKEGIEGAVGEAFDTPDEADAHLKGKKNERMSDVTFTVLPVWTSEEKKEKKK